MPQEGIALFSGKGCVRVGGQELLQLFASMVGDGLRDESGI